MRKQVVLVLSALTLVSVLGWAGYSRFVVAQTNSDAAPIASSNAGGTVTVQGSHLENGGCSYIIGTTTIQETIQETPSGSSGSASGSGAVAPGEAPAPSRMISQDRSNCTAVFGDASVTDSEEEGGSSASSFATPASPYSGNTVTIHGTPNEVGGCDYSGSGPPIHIIAEDSSTCTALMESATSGTDPEHERGSWASSTATATAAP